jgi:hypothetical protein
MGPIISEHRYRHLTQYTQVRVSLPRAQSAQSGAARKSRWSAVRCAGRNLRRFPWAERTVYHFVYHCSREGPLDDAITYFEQKQNPLI